MSNEDLGFVRRGLDKLLTRNDGLHELLKLLGELEARVAKLEAAHALLDKQHSGGLAAIEARLRELESGRVAASEVLGELSTRVRRLEQPASGAIASLRTPALASDGATVGDVYALVRAARDHVAGKVVGTDLSLDRLATALKPFGGVP